MEEEKKMTKLGTFSENTPHGNSFDSTDIAKILNTEEPKVSVEKETNEENN